MTPPDLELLATPVSPFRGTVSAAARPLYDTLMSIFAGSTDRVFVKDTVGRYIAANRATCDFFQRPLCDVVGKTDGELMSEEIVRRVSASDRAILNTGTSENYELKIVGTEKTSWMYVSKGPVRDEQGRIVGIIGIARDITQAKETELKLRESEQHLSTAQAIAHLGSWHWNLKTNELVWSEECFRIFGVDGAHFEPTYQNVARLIHPSDSARFRNVLAAGTRHGVEFKDDFRIVRPSGEERYIHVEGVVTELADDGSVVVMSGTNYDITERKNIELALRRSEANFAHAQRVAQVGSWEWNPVTSRTVMSREALRIFGLPEDVNLPMFRQDFLRMLHPDDRERVAAAIDAHIRGEAPFNLTFRIVWSDGSEHLIHSLGELHHDVDQLSLMTGVCRDITDQRRLLDQLSRSEATLAQAQRIAKIASWRWDMRNGSELWSQEILEILELPADSSPMTFRRFLDFVHPADRVQVSAAFNPMLIGVAPQALDFRVINALGQERFIHSLGETIYAEDHSATAIIGTLQDITERKKTEGELATSRDELRELTNHLQTVQEDERRRIAREIHDEFGAVFTAANLSLYRLTNLLSDATPAARDLAISTKDMLANAGKALDDIVNGLHPQMLNHLGLVATMEWYLSEFIRRSGLHCEFSLPSETLTVEDEVALTFFRCLQESLTNVVKHAAATMVKIDFKAHPRELVLFITDNGRGMPNEALAAADAFGIRGLRARVSQLGGSLRVQRAHPTGTDVTMLIPRSKSPN